MKKISLFAVLCIVVAGAANAEYSETVTTVTPMDNGYIVSSETITTTEQAKNMPDDTPVMLRGYIIKNLGDKMYVFQDSTDTITVEIDNGVWGGINVGPADMVIIRGEVDAEPSGAIVEVDSISMAN